ncbi:hypothetical protein [Mycobacterium interjectum]|uniref:hypothetical protein n=1 Tax=Mycobacterium interjectum TaxID=33895 RepID=UPI0021F2F409|nr:hypothetical protein [Mycobacterium interjectum]
MSEQFSSFEARGAKDADPTTASLVEDIARARGTDYFLMKDQLTDHEKEIMAKVRASERPKSCRSSTTTGNAPNSRSS